MMDDEPLGMRLIVERGERLFGNSSVETFDGTTLSSTSFVEVAVRARRLAAGLQAFGIGNGDRVATLCWNMQEHLEAYLAVPAMGIPNPVAPPPAKVKKGSSVDLEALAAEMLSEPKEQAPQATGTVDFTCPNCDAELTESDIWIIANRDVDAGDEITFNYGYDLQDFRDHPCHCGSPNCVGWIVADEFFAQMRANRLVDKFEANGKGN